MSTDPTSTIQETHSTEFWLGNALYKTMTSSGCYNNHGCNLIMMLTTELIVCYFYVDNIIISLPSLSATQTTAGFVHITSKKLPKTAMKQ